MSTQLDKFATAWSFPTQLGGPWRLKNGTIVSLRPIRRSDESQLARFHKMLSDRTVYLRYFSFVHLHRRIAQEELAATCQINRRNFALVAVREREDAGEEILGLGQMSRDCQLNEVECAVVVRDDHQRQGLGKRISECLLQVSRRTGVRRAVSLILHENDAMRAILRTLGFSIQYHVGDHALRATLALHLQAQLDALALAA